MESGMIFGLPAILGFIPLVIYIVMALRGKNLTLTVFVCVVIGAIMTTQTFNPIQILINFGATMQASLGSFMAMIGFIIMLGSGMGEVLSQTKVAHNIVHLVMTRLKIKTQTTGLLVAMLLSTLLVAALGTMAGANAILSPIVIPILAGLAVTPSTLGLALHGAGAAGLFIGPFVPPVVTILELTGMSYTSYLFSTGLPAAAIVWLVTFFSAKRNQKLTLGISAYEESDLVSEDLEATPAMKRGTTVFLICMLALIGGGIAFGAGASYAIVIMLTTSFVTGISAGMKPTAVLEAVIKGCEKMFWMFLMFCLFDPFMNYITESGAFTALAELLQPILAGAGTVVFLMVSTLIGIFGISGAAVAQSKVIHDLFGPTVVAMGIPMAAWSAVLLVGSQITSFAFPTGDMVGQMGLARSKDLKAMLTNGYRITLGTCIFVLLKALFM